MTTRLRGLRGPTATVVAALLALLILTSCSQDGGDASSGSDDAGLSEGALEDSADMAPKNSAVDGVIDTTRNGSQSGGNAQNAALLEPRDLIKTGSVSLRSDNVGSVIQQITALVVASGGEIAAESTSTDRDGEQSYSQLLLRVPVDEFDTTLNGIAELATLTEKVRDSKDVTTQVADVDSRVRSAQDSLVSLRRLFVRATRLGEIIALESQLHQRQADLESLLAQQRTLAEQTAMSRITVSISKPPVDKPKPKPDNDDQAGFVTGVKQGWDAFTTFVIGVGHTIGLVLPLGTLFLILGVLVWTGVRRRMPHQQPQPTE